MTLSKIIKWTAIGGGADNLPVLNRPLIGQRPPTFVIQCNSDYGMKSMHDESWYQES